MGLYGLVSLAVVTLSLKAQNAPAGAGPNEPAKLSGSSIKTEDIVSKCDAIFIGQIADIGSPNLRAAGQAVFYGVQVKVLQVLRGSVDGPVVVSLCPIHKSGIQEGPPRLGSSYIFFVNKKDHITVLKLLPATDDNITKVKALIAALPPPK